MRLLDGTATILLLRPAGALDGIFVMVLSIWRLAIPVSPGPTEDVLNDARTKRLTHQPSGYPHSFAVVIRIRYRATARLATRRSPTTRKPEGNNTLLPLRPPEPFGLDDELGIPRGSGHLPAFRAVTTSNSANRPVDFKGNRSAKAISFQ